MFARILSSKHWLAILGPVLFILAGVSCQVEKPLDSTSLAAQLYSKIPAVFARGNSPSIQAAVVAGDQIVWSAAYGEQTSPEHVYMNASMQKMFTAVAVLQLVERGLVDLDADVQDYLPFTVRHPAYRETPITVRMLLAHRSGMNELPYQFEWDTQCTFSPQYRPPCPDHLVNMSLESFYMAALEPGGASSDLRGWGAEPGKDYSYSVSAYPLLRYLVGQVAGTNYEDYVRENIFEPLEMAHSGFSAAEFTGRHAIPYTRIDGRNIELPLWDGRGSMMRTTAEDMARFMRALLNEGLYNDFQLLRPETVELMRQETTRFKYLFRSSEDLPSRGHGLGLFIFRGGWIGFGGSAPGYQSLMRFHPTKEVGYVIFSNVNAILGGGENYESARREIYDVQNGIMAILDPMFALRYQTTEILLILAAGLMWAFFLRKRPNVLTVLGIIQILAGAVWTVLGWPVGLGLLVAGLIGLLWGQVTLSSSRRSYFVLPT